jgi:hypothetical protein
VNDHIPFSQEPAMPFASLIRRPALVAVGFSLVAALPAAAMPLNQPIAQFPHPNLPVLSKPVDQKPVLNKPIDFKPIFVPNKQPVKPIPVDLCVIAPSKCKNPPNNPPPNGGNGGKGPVVIITPPPVIAPAPVLVAPQPTIISRPQPVYVPRPVAVPSAAVSNVAANAPATCLTKQYQDDGSVVFRDVCTGETAIATKEDLEAQAASRTQAASQIQDQTQATPAR